MSLEVFPPGRATFETLPGRFSFTIETTSESTRAWTEGCYRTSKFSNRRIVVVSDGFWQSKCKRFYVVCRCHCDRSRLIAHITLLQNSYYLDIFSN